MWRLVVISVFIIGRLAGAQGPAKLNITSDDASGLMPSQTYGGVAENIDFSTGNLNLAIPLMGLAGRHGHDLNISLIYDSKPLTSLSGTWDQDQGFAVYGFG